MAEIVLKKGKSRPILQGHQWIFSGAVDKVRGKADSGQRIEVYDSDHHFLGVGHYYPEGSIQVRMISREVIEDSDKFWKDVIHRAFSRRKLLITSETNCCRLVHGEGDGLPGLIVDLYKDVIVIQTHTDGMSKEIDYITKAIQSQDLFRINTIYWKSLHHETESDEKDRFLLGEAEETVCLENGNKFLVNWAKGQKTGFFLDQRDNRRLLGSLSKDMSVLNAFCYTGGFSIYSLAGGAREVDSIDISASAMDTLEKNIELNGFGPNHRSITDNVMTYLTQEEKNYDIVIIDPPAFAKSVKKKHKAIQAYNRLNQLALARVNPGGVLATFSCSQVIDTELFFNTVRTAAIQSKKKVEVIKKMDAGIDHPYPIVQTESSYLKGLLLRVE